ncbi:MAG: hypothetical protein LBH44_03540 [Treponema sp.]|jgi:hypothetical protein|nr:hypothetical protein [Treponema sp.]
MKKYSWIVALLLALSLSFFACEYLEDDGEAEEGEGEIIAEMYVSDAELVVASPQAMLVWTLSQDDLDNFGKAKYAVIISQGSKNKDGFPGANVILQVKTSWDENGIMKDGWEAFAHDDSEEVFIVLELGKLKNYDNLVKADPKNNGAKFFIQSWPVTDWGIRSLLLVGPGLEKPANSTDLKSGFGYMTKNFELYYPEEEE